MRQTLLALLLTASPALAECPAVPDHEAALDMLFAQMAEAGGEAEARVLNSRMWELWTDAPDEIAQEMLNQAMIRRESYDFLGALGDLNRLVEYCPHYAEGWNQRAFVHFLREDYTAALPDLERAIALSPRHVGALSGRALTLLGLERLDEAREALGEALALNPWLAERGLVAPGGPLAPKGKDI